MKYSLIALALAAVLPLSAHASELSYSYVEADYMNIDGDADGFGARGSINFGESDFYGFGSYGSVEIDNTSFDIDMSDIGVGYHYAMNDKAHLLAELAYVNVNVDSYASIGDVFLDAHGYRTSVGVRGLFTDNLEGSLKANYVDGQDFSGDFSGTAGLQYKFNPTWGLVGEVEFNDDGEAYLAGVRASF